LTEYKLNNDIKILTENDIQYLILPKNVKIEILNENYRLFYRNGIYYSENKNIIIR